MEKIFEFTISMKTCTIRPSLNPSLRKEKGLKKDERQKLD